MGILPLGGECPQGGAEALAGKVGLTGFIEHQEAGVVDDELGAFGPGHRVPADPGVAIFEAQGAGGLDHDRHRHSVAPDDLPEAMACGPCVSQAVFRFEPIFAEGQIFGAMGNGDFQPRADALNCRHDCCEYYWRVHPTLNSIAQHKMSSGFSPAPETHSLNLPQ